jgi:hypothetical protein
MVVAGSHAADGANAWHCAWLVQPGKHKSRPSADSTHSFITPALLVPHPALLVQSSVHQSPWPEEVTQSSEAQSPFDVHLSPIFPVPVPTTQSPMLVFSTVVPGTHVAVRLNDWH